MFRTLVGFLIICDSFIFNRLLESFIPASSSFYLWILNDYLQIIFFMIVSNSLNRNKFRPSSSFQYLRLFHI